MNHTLYLRTGSTKVRPVATLLIIITGMPTTIIKALPDTEAAGKSPLPGRGWPRRGRERNLGGNVLVSNTLRPVPAVHPVSSLGTVLIRCTMLQVSARIPLPTRHFLAALGRATFSPGEGICGRLQLLHNNDVFYVIPGYAPHS